MLKPITETCVPRDDVLVGGLADNHFAAQLDQVVRDPGGYPVYGDADEFFALTYPTTGLRHLLARTFGRLSGVKIEGAEHGVIRSETSFGGGKTHGLMAVWHLACGARPTNLEEFVEPDLLPANTQIAAVVADTLDPVNGLETNGMRTHTLWGEIAAQLGPEAYAKLRPSDEGRTAPGKATWEEIVGDEPTIVIIDELAHHLRQLTSSGDPDVRRMAGAIPNFLKSLFELAAGKPSVVVILTLATRKDAYGHETEEVGGLLDELQGEFQSTLTDTKSVLSRTGTVVKPAEDFEIGQILKRRLFASVDQQAAAEAAAAYRSAYEHLRETGEELAGGAESPASYAENIAAAYPFHPELIRVLDKRIGTIDAFQRARGALRLLAEVVAGVWESASSAHILNVADIDYSRSEVLSHLTIGIDRPDFEGVAKVDFAGPGSHATAIDQARFAGRAPYATRACTTAFTHSLELVATAGAGRADLLLGTLRPADDPAIVTEALAEVEKVAWHLFYDGTRWRFQTEPNANRIVAEEVKNVPSSKVGEALADLVMRAFPSEAPVKAVHFPEGPGDLPDETALRLVVFHHDDLAVDAASAASAPERVRRLLDHAGASERIRSYRNAQAFLVADADAKEAMRDRVRTALAARALVADNGRLSGYSPDVRRRLHEIADRARLEERVAIARCFKHLYFPWQDRSSGYLRHVELNAKAQGEADKPQSRVVLQALTDEGKVRTSKLGTDYLRSRAWPNGAVEITTAALAEAFWRDHGAQLVLDPTLLRDAIRDGVRNGSWVYFNAQGQRAWTADEAPPPVEISPESILYTLQRAAELELLGREVRFEDVSAVMDEPTMAGPKLRAVLAERVGREPKKGELTEVLARAAEGGEQARIVAVAGTLEPGARSCTPAEVRKASLDALTVLTPEEANRRLIVRGLGRASRIVEGRGVAGVAFQALADKAVEVPSNGLETLSITAYADPGEGPRDLSLLGKAVGMLPRVEVAVALDIELDFAGLRPGVEISLQGSGADYGRAEGTLLAFARAASAVSGTLRLDLSFREPAPVTGPEFDRVRKAVAELQPGTISLRGVLGA